MNQCLILYSYTWSIFENKTTRFVINTFIFCYFLHSTGMAHCNMHDIVYIFKDFVRFVKT